MLGPIEVWHGDVQASLGSDPQRTLLARLALGVGTAVGQDELIELLWRHGGPRNAVSLLHPHVARLRRLLDGEARTDSVLVGGRTGYRLVVLRQQDRQARRATGWTAVQQAPAAPPDFVGRAAELDRIENAFAGPDQESGPASSRIVLIGGIAGVGKTALALAAAQRLRTRYPDGQLYADLRGTAATAPEPMRVLSRFLRALGVPDRRIGTDEAEAASVFRSELADRRMLVLLDNARDADEIRPLLPGAGGSDVIVTSRRRLLGLAGATVIDLEPLAQDEAVTLIATTAGSHRANADPGAAGALAEACGRLPLALRIASARLATRQAWTIGDLVHRLRDDHHRLTELSTSESSVLNSFQLSYADLSGAAQRAFRLCGLHPGDDFGTESTGALLAMSTSEADRVLEDLLEANMLMRYTTNRYRFHDLLGLYARRLLAEDTETETACSRLYTWYAEAVTAAMEWVYPQLVRLETHAERDRFFVTGTDALAWLDAELPALVAVVRRCGRSAGTRRRCPTASPASSSRAPPAGRRPPRTCPTTSGGSIWSRAGSGTRTSGCTARSSRRATSSVTCGRSRSTDSA